MSTLFDGIETTGHLIDIGLEYLKQEIITSQKESKNGYK